MENEAPNAEAHEVVADTPHIVETVPPVRKNPYQEKLLALERSITKQDDEIDRLADKLKVAKALREAMIGDLRKAIREADQPELPFEGDGVESVDDWKEVLLDEVLKGHVSDKVIEKLTEAELVTVGQMAEYTAKCRLTDIKGIGPAKAEEIEKALEQFWASRAPVPADGMVLPRARDESGEVEAPPQEEAASEPADSVPDQETLAQLDGGD